MVMGGLLVTLDLLSGGSTYTPGVATNEKSVACSQNKI
jgi:hypothetical protein